VRFWQSPDASWLDCLRLPYSLSRATLDEIATHYG
jgi:hypothetical protein